MFHLKQSMVSCVYHPVWQSKVGYMSGEKPVFIQWKTKVMHFKRQGF